MVLSQSSPVCELWTTRHLLSKQTGSLTSHCDTVFSGYKVLSGLGDGSMHLALGDSSSKSRLLFQEPFKTFSSKYILKKKKKKVKKLIFFSGGACSLNLQIQTFILIYFYRSDRHLSPDKAFVVCSSFQSSCKKK